MAATLYVSYRASDGFLMREGVQTTPQFLEPGYVGFAFTPPPVIIDPVSGKRLLDWDAKAAAAGKPGYTAVT